MARQCETRCVWVGKDRMTNLMLQDRLKVTSVVRRRRTQVRLLFSFFPAPVAPQPNECVDRGDAELQRRPLNRPPFDAHDRLVWGTYDRGVVEVFR